MSSKPVSEQPADLVYDPYNYEIDRDPYPVWKRMRDEAPLYYNDQHDFYALSRFQDVHDCLENWQDYSSADGTVLEIMDNPAAMPQGKPGEANLGMMIFSDPPDHDIAKSLVQLNFSPRMVADYEGRVRELAVHFLDQVQGKSTFDFVNDVVRPIPPMMIGHLLGVPEKDQAHLGKMVDQSLAYDPEADPAKIEGGIRKGNDSHMAIAQYMGGLVAERTANPQDDIISMLIQADVKLADGRQRRLEISELISFFMLLQGAGSETTARALAWAGVLLSRFPEQRQILVEDPSKIRNAIEELLRYEAPSPIQARRVMRDVEWYGVTVPKGSKIALLNGSAGRDERQYEDPEKFDVQRKIQRHLSFGFGKHVCLGAALARLEMKVLLEEMLKRYPEWYVDESGIELVHTTTVRGPATVPVQIP